MATIRTIEQLMQEAKEAELSGDLSTAVRKYEQVLLKEKSYELIYKRLMILYRKLKKPKEELRIINSGIRYFQEQFKERTESLYKNNRRISYLSKAIIKSLGHHKEQSDSFYEPAPIPAWKHRKLIVLKKIKPDGRH